MFYIQVYNLLEAAGTRSTDTNSQNKVRFLVPLVKKNLNSLQIAFLSKLYLLFIKIKFIYCAFCEHDCLCFIKQTEKYIKLTIFRDTKVRLGPLDMGDWYDFWVRAETRVGQGPASSIATILAQNSGNSWEFYKGFVQI